MHFAIGSCNVHECFGMIFQMVHQTPAMIAAAAVQEDVDCVGLSILSGAHNALVPAIANELKDRGAENIPLFLGGIIPKGDVEGLKEHGVFAVFTPGASLDSIVEAVSGIVQPREGASS